MAFVWKLWLSPAAYETLYGLMHASGDASVKVTINRLLLSADEAAIVRALALAERREAMR